MDEKINIMKVKVKENKGKEIKYPCLMLSNVDNKIVLFYAYCKGTHLKTGGYSEVWNMNAFTPFNGSITLEND